MTFSRNFIGNIEQTRVQLPTKSQRKKYLENLVEVEQRSDRYYF